MRLDLDGLQRATCEYFRDCAHPLTGLVADHSQPGSPCSIAALGFALTCLPIQVERGWMPRRAAAARALCAARFLARSPQGPEADASGYRGFFYHFLALDSGRRVWSCELSTIDTALLIAGLLTAAQYFDGAADGERELRELADRLYRRVEWDWAISGADAPLGHGWTPERGIIPHRWEGHTEALILYALALGSPTHPIAPASYRAACRLHDWRTSHGLAHVHAAPLFIHCFAQVWLELAGIHDEAMAARGCDYAENARRAALAQSAYADENPLGFAGYGRDEWGFTAGEGPGDQVIRHRERALALRGYHARGAPGGDDDGTIAPWAPALALPFAPEAASRALATFCARDGGVLVGRYGLVSGINETAGWRSQRWLGIDNGPAAALIENHRTGLIWRLMRGCRPVIDGLRAAGFSGGWLGGAPVAA